MATTSHQCKHHTSSNATEQIRFEHYKCKKIYNEWKLSVRRILKTSPNLEATKLYEIASTKHVNSGSIINKIITVELEKYKVKKSCHKIFNKNNNEKKSDDFMQLKEKSNIIQSITIRSSKEISRRQRLVKDLSINKYKEIISLEFSKPSKS